MGSGPLGSSAITSWGLISAPGSQEHGILTAHSLDLTSQETLPYFMKTKYLNIQASGAAQGGVYSLFGGSLVDKFFSRF